MPWGQSEGKDTAGTGPDVWCRLARCCVCWVGKHALGGTSGTAIGCAVSEGVWVREDVNLI